MNDVVYLVISPRGVQRMTKTLPTVNRGETIIKVAVKVDAKAFEPPVLSQEIYVNSWREGIDMVDVEFRQNFITEEEAEAIRQRRLAKMREILENQGYKVELNQA